MAEPKSAVADQVHEGELVTGDTTLVRTPNQTPTVITTSSEYQASLDRWTKSKYHILAPFTNFSGLPQGFGIMPALVKIDPDPEHKEVYVDNLFCKGDEVAIAKVGLSKIAIGLGASIKTRRMDSGAIPNYYQLGATARIIGLSGTPQEFDAMLEYDLRDGSARIAKHKPGQLVGSRAHGLAGGESRVINRAIRQFGIRQAYSAADLARPFLCIRIAFQPDMSDPEVRKVVTQIAMQGTSMFFGPPTTPAPGGELSTLGAPDPVAALPPAQTQAAQPAPASTAATPAPAPPAIPDGYGVIRDLKTETLKRKKDQSPFTKWRVIDAKGVEHVTVKQAFGESLDRCWKAKTPVEIISAENDYEENEISEINPLNPEQPTLPPVDKL